MTDFKYPETCESPEDRARFWAICQSSGRFDRGVRAALEAWLCADPQNPRRLAIAWALCDVQRHAGQMHDPDDYGGADACLRTQDQQEDMDGVADQMAAQDGLWRRPVRRSRWMWGMALIPLVLLGGFGWPVMQPGPDISVGTQASSAMVRTLSDGNIVWMAPGTKLNAGFIRGVHHLELREGAVFIDMKTAKTPHIPGRTSTELSDQNRAGIDPGVFDIRAGDLHVRVHGQATFDVSRWGTFTRVAVGSGTIDVAGARGMGQAITLEAGQDLLQGEDMSASLAMHDQRDIAPWRSGRWQAVSMPMAEFVARIDAVTPGRHYFLSSDLSRATISGDFDSSDPTSALRAALGQVGGTIANWPFGIRWITRW
jgi:transmembrane sensor